MKRTKCKVVFLALVFSVLLLILSGCDKTEKQGNSIAPTCSEVVTTSRSCDLPEILIDQSGKPWNDFFYYNSDGYVYVFDNKICLTESAPDSFDTVLTITYKADKNLKTELLIHKQSLQLESLSINLNSPVFEGECVNYSIVTYPADASHGNYTITFDKPQYIEQQDENSFKLIDTIPEEEEIAITVTEESGITAKKSFKLPKKYYIYNNSQLQKISDDPTGYYILKSDLDLSDIKWRPISTFSGKLDGNGYTISGMNISRGAYSGDSDLFLGLFGNLYGTVKNLTIKDSSIEVASEHNGNGWISAGIVVGLAYNGSTIDHVSVYNSSVKVHRNKSEIGGIVGDSRSTISYCTVYGITIYGNGSEGGIVGGATGSVVNCVVNGYNDKKSTVTHWAVDGNRRQIGGIVGFSNGASILVCHVINLDMKLDAGYSHKPCMGYIVGEQKGGKVYHVGYEESSCSYSPDKEDSVMLGNNGLLGVGNYDYREFFFSVGWGYAGKLTDNPTIE